MPFLLAAMQMEGQNPLRQRDVAALHDGADRHRELLAAGAAVEQPGAVRLAFQAVDVLSEPQCAHTGPFGQRAPSSHSRALASSLNIGAVRSTDMAQVPVTAPIMHQLPRFVKGIIG